MAITANRSTSEEPIRRANGKSSAQMADDILNDVVSLIKAEFGLLRAEIFEKFKLGVLSIALAGVGVILLLTTLILLLEAAVAALALAGFSWVAAILIVAGGSLLAGAALVWFGIRNLTPDHLAPTKTIRQISRNIQDVP
jgi:hypothetical protein